MFASGGEMGALMAEADWSRSSLGPPEEWPEMLIAGGRYQAAFARLIRLRSFGSR